MAGLTSPNPQQPLIMETSWICISLLDASFFFRGASAQTPSPPPFFSGGICCFIRACRSHQSAYFILQMRSGVGRLPEKRGPGVTWPLWTAQSSLTLPLIELPPTLAVYGLRDSGGQRLICEDTWPSGGGLGYPLQKPLPPVFWTMTNEACFMTSTDEQPRALLGSPSNANDTNSGSLNRAGARFFYVRRHVQLSSEHVRLCSNAKVHAVSSSLELLAFYHFYPTVTRCLAGIDTKPGNERPLKA